MLGRPRRRARRLRPNRTDEAEFCAECLRKTARRRLLSCGERKFCIRSVPEVLVRVRGSRDEVDGTLADCGAVLGGSMGSGFESSGHVGPLVLGWNRRRIHDDDAERLSVRSAARDEVSGEEERSRPEDSGTADEAFERDIVGREVVTVRGPSRRRVRRGRAASGRSGSCRRRTWRCRTRRAAGSVSE